MPRRSLLLALLLLTSLTGCVGSEPAEDPQAPAERSGTPAPRTLSLYLDEGMGLTPTSPEQEEPARVPVGSFYGAWAQGEEQPTWTQQAATTSDLRITEVTLTFYYTSEQATATTGPRTAGFPEFVVYFGTEQAPMAWASLEGPDVVTSEDVVEVQGELALPAGGLVLPEGSQPVVKIAPVQGQQDEAAQVEILVNSTETPSHVRFTGATIELPDHQATQVLDETGTLTGQAYVIGQTEGLSSMSFPVEITEAHVGLIATMERTEGTGIADIDLEVLGPDGEVVARSVTPEDDEGIALYHPNLEAVGPGEWTLRVTNYGNVQAEFSLDASLLEAV